MIRVRGPWYVSINDCLLCVLESRFSELRRLGVNDVRAFADLGRAVMDLASMVEPPYLLNHLIIL